MTTNTDTFYAVSLYPFYATGPSPYSGSFKGLSKKETFKNTLYKGAGSKRVTSFV